MADLVQEYFRRDLSLQELDQLEALLEGPDENAERFAALAAAFYASLRLPEGPGGGRHGLGWKGLGLGLALAGAAAAWWLRGRPEPVPPPFAPVPAKGASLGTGQGVRAEVRGPAKEVPEARSTVAPKPKAPPTLPAPTPAGASLPGAHTYDGLSLEIAVPSQGIVTVQVLDRQGRLRRRLFAGVLDAGSSRLKWDGLDDRGRPVEDGVYTLEVRQGAYKQSGRVVLRRSAR